DRRRQSLDGRPGRRPRSQRRRHLRAAHHQERPQARQATRGREEGEEGRRKEEVRNRTTETQSHREGRLLCGSVSLWFGLTYLIFCPIISPTVRVSGPTGL